MENLRSATNILLTGIEEKISKYGFLYKKKDKSFKREIDGFTQIFDLIFTKKREGIYVEPTIRLKSKAIENIYHLVSKKDPKYFEGTKVLGNNLFKIIKYYKEGLEVDTNEKQSYLIEEVNDIKILINVISENFIDFGIKYFDENSSVSRIDYLLNNNPRDISVHNWFYPVRACVAIIAAKLNNNERFTELKNIYKEEMNDSVAPYKDEFNYLINDIL